MKRALFTFAALLMISGAAFADDADVSKSLSVRTFTFKYKDPGKAAEIIKPLLSTEGSISIQAGSNALVVTDRPDVLKTLAKTLGDYDAPPQAFKLVVRLIGASHAQTAP